MHPACRTSPLYFPSGNDELNSRLIDPAPDDMLKSNDGKVTHSWGPLMRMSTVSVVQIAKKFASRHNEFFQVSLLLGKLR